ncbi:RPM1 interacting protein 13-like [Phragmites australis]|uniref:RPM1 interacting protein 13-like n=1 Tax=Phragmites australis TaxID=29695 RepID=UPI002D76AC42|nr:RPM1 interacting protein 13-like [Phragmites australis]
MAPVGGVVDISSDEEDSPVGNKLPLDPLGWASDLFDVDDDAIGDDFDDLMIMSELSSPPVLQKTTKPDDLLIMSEWSSPLVLQNKTKPDGGRDEDDDDCVVLDGDPDKVVTVAEEDGSEGDGSSDELQIVAEKGQIACRDFPHSRYLCSNLPFSTTSHVMHCSMCHCFVCDAPAPCNYWGNGTSVADHCHAVDKETKWKTLRQAFKCKTLPASGPEKHQNAMCSTVMSPRQQAQVMHHQVAAPQSLSSSVPNMGHPSLANRSPLASEVSQNQQRHPSVRVSLSVAGTVSTPRAGRGTGNAHIAQNTQSHAIFKRVGVVSPGVTTTTVNRFGSAATPDNSLMHQTLTHVSQPVQVAPRTYSFTGTAQNNPPQRSFSAPIAFQTRQGQPAAYCHVASNGTNVIGPQLSQCSSLTTQRTQCLQEPVIDVCTKSWEDILASVASDLFDMGVPDDSISTAQSQHLTTNSGPVHSTVSQGLGLQHESVAATENLTSSHVDDLFNQTTGGNVQADGSLQTTQNWHHLNHQSSPVPSEALLNDFASAPADGAHLNDFVSVPADGLSIEAAHHSEVPRLESTNILHSEVPRLESTNILFEFDWG